MRLRSGRAFPVVVLTLALALVLAGAACGGESSPAAEAGDVPAIAEPVTTLPAEPAASPPVGVTAATTTVATTVGPTPTVAIAATSTSAITAAPAAPSTTATGEVEQLTVEVVSSIPHDPGSYTQGLVLDGGTLYESAGNYGDSDVRRVDPATGAVLASSDNDPSEFGEGLALVDGQLIQLTWQEGTAHVLDAATLARVGSFSYEGEGWGICHDGERLVMSNGSAELTFRDPDTFVAVGSVNVTHEGQPLERLNELECVDGSVYANVYLTDTIMRIDPSTGRITGVIDASALRTGLGGLSGDEVLNGIAHVEGSDRFLLTGKHWPTMFEVRFAPQQG